MCQQFHIHVFKYMYLKKYIFSSFSTNCCSNLKSHIELSIQNLSHIFSRMYTVFHLLVSMLLISSFLLHFLSYFQSSHALIIPLLLLIHQLSSSLSCRMNISMTSVTCGDLRSRSLWLYPSLFFLVSLLVLQKKCSIFFSVSCFSWVFYVLFKYLVVACSLGMQCVSSTQAWLPSRSSLDWLRE